MNYFLYTKQKKKKKLLTQETTHIWTRATLVGGEY